MAQCMFPYHVDNPLPTSQEDTKIPVPCGRCPECLKRRSTQWGFRLQREEERSDSALFVTLTYDSLYIPLTKNGFMTLRLTDVQKFFKRLRELHKLHSKSKIRYYYAGEYGSTRRRPHYHIILFNATPFDVAKAWCDPITRQPIGQIDIGTVSGASIAYTVKYINKGRWQPLHKNDDRTPEFSCMSKGLGKSYLSEKTVAYHRNDLSRAFIVVQDGLKMALPRYYKNKIFPISTNNAIAELHPSILIHLDDNKKLRARQGEIVKQMLEQQKPIAMTDRELHESRKQAIENFKKKYSKRSDL